MIEFVNRDKEKKNIRDTRIQIKQSKVRVLAIDSPAGMGKTYLLKKVCQELVDSAAKQQVEWRIVWLDFHANFPEQYNNQRDILREIARQIFRDVAWNNICELIQSADPRDQELIQQATLIPMTDQERSALFRMVAHAPPEDLARINGLIANALADVDIQAMQHQLQTVGTLRGFILAERERIPGHVFLILDGVDAIQDDALRHWVVNDLAVNLATHRGLQQAFARFVVIISGRFLDQDIDVQTQSDLEPLELPSFVDKFDHVAELVRQLGDKQFNQDDVLVSQLARKLAQVCGGHPKVIKAMAVELYNSPGNFAALQMDPQRPGYWYNQELFRTFLQQHRASAIEEILGDMAPRKRCLLGLLSVFRKFTSATLEFLERKIREEQPHRYYEFFQGEAMISVSATRSVGIVKSPPQPPDLAIRREQLTETKTEAQGDINTLYELLKDTRLIGPDGTGPFYTDRFSLRLLAAQMEDEDEEMFDRLNHWAVGLFADWFKGKFSDDPDILTPYPIYQQVSICEWLFHRLHLAESCPTPADAFALGQQIEAELADILKDVMTYPGQSQSDRRQSIRQCVAGNKQIEHLLWEVALEDAGRYGIIQSHVWNAF